MRTRSSGRDGMAEMEFRTERFTYDGHQLVYDIYGEGERVVVYLHGLLVDSDLNRAIAEQVAERGYRVVLLDLLGHGRSDAPEHATAYRIDTYAEQVVALLDELGEERAVLGGMSLGANVSLFTAVEHPERVRGLIVEMPVLEWATPSAALLFVPLLLAVHYARPVVSWFSRSMGRVPQTPWPPIDSLVHAVTRSPDAMAAILHGVLVGPVAPTLEERRAIEVPALVLGHRRDLIHPFDDAANLADQLPHGTMVAAGSPLELRRRPERLVRVIADFLDGVWAEEERTDPGDRAAYLEEASGGL